MSTYEQSNYVRAINVAGAIVAQADTGELTAKDVAANVLDLAEYIAVGQDKYFDKNGFEGRVAAPAAAAPSSGGGGSSGGLSAKQLSSVTAALGKIDGPAPYTIEQLEALDASGGTNSERSKAIGEIFSKAYDN